MVIWSLRHFKNQVADEQKRKEENVYCQAEVFVVIVAAWGWCVLREVIEYLI